MMPRKPQKSLDCFCHQKVPYENESHLKEHIQNCPNYRQESPFYKYFNSLNLNQLPEVHLVAIRCEFMNYIDKISMQLNRIGYEGAIELRPGVSVIANNSSQMMSSRIGFSSGPPLPKAFNRDQVECGGCHKKFDSNFDSDKFYYLYSCLHLFCKGCLIKQINNDYPLHSKASCKNCSRDMVFEDFVAIVGKEKFEQLEQKAILIMYNLVSCVKCKAQFEFQSGSASQSVRDANGQQLNAQQQQHYAENRFICQQASCRTDQCKSCQTQPYHLGFTCESYRSHQLAKRCRYCDEQIQQVQTNQPLALQDICKKEECDGKKKNACQKMLNCNHPCYGIKDELNCPPCLHTDCVPKHNETMDLDADSYCNICWTDSLQADPCVQLGCKHVFHYSCLKKRLEIKWVNARIVFTFCFCPLCKTWMEFQLDCDLNSEMQKFFILFENVKKKSLDRLKFEERLKDEKLVSPTSPFYNQPQDYAMAIYAYFMCFKCKKPYFGGLKDCQRGLEDDKREFDPKELVCANCCEIPIENCAKHGKDYIEFKCKFCCNVAQWFCWGTTHFCESCHKRQCNGDYVSKLPRDKLPKCLEGNKCPVGGNHKPNGDEAALGCSLCRNARDNQKEF